MHFSVIPRTTFFEGGEEEVLSICRWYSECLLSSEREREREREKRRKKRREKRWEREGGKRERQLRHLYIYNNNGLVRLFAFISMLFAETSEDISRYFQKNVTNVEKFTILSFLGFAFVLVFVFYLFACLFVCFSFYYVDLKKLLAFSFNLYIFSLFLLFFYEYEDFE